MSRKKRKPMIKEPVEVSITGLTHDGRGVGRVKDKVVFVLNALPGERVIAQYRRSFSRFDEAIAIEIHNASPYRIIPACPHFGVCGGCQLQHVSLDAQIQWKQELLQEQLNQVKILPDEWLSPLTGDSLGYRNKARLGVKYVKNKDTVAVGFREQKNNKIALIESCQVLDPRLGQHIQALREMLYHLEGRECIAQIEAAIGGDEVALVFRHLQPLSEKDTTVLIEFCQRFHFSLYFQPKGYDSVYKVWPTSPKDLQYDLLTQQLTYRFHPLDFTQVNPQMNQQMVDQALALLDPGPTEKVLDLFCGLGNFSLPLAQRAKMVVGVEGAAHSVNRARENAIHNKLENVEFYASDLSVDFTHCSWANNHYDKILLDPPRCGANEVIERILRFKAKAILYISCNPATFVKDAAVLVHKHGLQLTKVGVMDMFSHTAHVETMGLFQPKR